jgi:dolichol-phosphate mannosyltransferase
MESPPLKERRVVVVPTYNERAGLPHLLERFPEEDFDLLIVDDSSPDGTAELVRELQAARPWLHLLVRPEKDGLAGAYRAGFAWALAEGYQVIGQMDSDLQHPPETLAVMLEALAGADLVVASRYVPGGGVGDWSPTRRFLSRLGGIPSTILLRLPVKDPSGGFKLWRGPALAAIDIASTISRGYVFQVETTYRARRAGLRIKEVPFRFASRDVGESKMELAISREGIAVVARLLLHPWYPSGRAR